MLAHKYLPNNIHRILYLDIDIAVNGKLDDLYNLDFEDNYLIASKEVFNAKYEPTEEFEKFEKISIIDKNLAAAGRYFNSGVLLFNLDKFRSNKIDIDFYLKKILGCDNIFYDQGILNLSFADSTKLLTTCKYNYRISFSARDYFNNENRISNDKIIYTFYPIKANIIHFCGFIMNFKPWYLHFNSFEIPNSEDNFLGLIPECADILKIWWEYAKLVPDYEQLWSTQQINKSAYNLLYNITATQCLPFINKLGLETLKVPIWRQQNNINNNEDLNNFVNPRVYRCKDGNTKISVKNLPPEFTQKCGFRLTVKNINAYNGIHTPVLQILETNSNDAAVYRRQGETSGKWGKWYKTATTSELNIISQEQNQLAAATELLSRNQVQIKSEFENKIANLDTVIRKSIADIYAAQDSNFKQLNSKINKISTQLATERQHYKNIQNSLSHKIGRAITYIPRKIRDLFKRKK